MKTLVGISLLIFQSAYGQNEQPPVQNILNGADSVLGEFPYMAGLRRYEQDIYCGGALISYQHVVTAAHCVANIPTEDITVLLGTHDLLNGGEYYEVAQKVVTDDYSLEHEAIGIAVLKLAKKVQFSYYLAKVQLPTNNVADGATATFIGYGYQVKDSANGFMSQILQKLPVNVVNQESCAKQLEKYESIKPQHLCGYTAPNYGACYGDSGSPLVYDNQLIGVALSVYPDCAEGNPDLYARITHYSTFIRQTISQ